MNFGALANIGSKVGNLFKTNYGQNTLQKDLSSGNKLTDFGLGTLSGLAGGDSQKGWYMPTFNYMGNGLAKNDMSYIQNRDYFNPYDASNAISAVLKRGGNKNPLSRLGGLFNRNRNKQAGGFEPVNTMSDYIGNAVNGSPLRTEGVMGNLQEQINYGGYIPQFLPSSFEERGGFDNSMM